MPDEVRKAKRFESAFQDFVAGCLQIAVDSLIKRGI